jgi:hypothetical protein
VRSIIGAGGGDFYYSVSRANHTVVGSQGDRGNITFIAAGEEVPVPLFQVLLVAQPEKVPQFVSLMLASFHAVPLPILPNTPCSWVPSGTEVEGVEISQVGVFRLMAPLKDKRMISASRILN